MAGKKSEEFFETEDIFKASQKIRSYFGYHHLVNSNQKSFYFKEETVHLANLSLFEFTLMGELSVEHYTLADAYVFHFPLNGYFLVKSGLEVKKVSPEQMFILSPNDAPHFSIPQGVKVLIIHIEAKYLVNFAREVLQHQPVIDLVFPLTDHPEEVVVSIRDSILNVLANNKLITKQSVKEIHFKQAQPYLLSLLLTLIDNSFTSLLQLNPNKTLPLVVRQARRFMLENIGEVITLDDLCRASNASKRTLIYQFKKHTENTPVAYLLGLRLDRLREEIKQGNASHNILEMAIKLGLNHPGRLAKHYRVRFGELPSQTKS